MEALQNRNAGIQQMRVWDKPTLSRIIGSNFIKESKAQNQIVPYGF